LKELKLIKGIYNIIQNIYGEAQTFEFPAKDHFPSEEKVKDSFVQTSQEGLQAQRYMLRRVNGPSEQGRSLQTQEEVPKLYKCQNQ
jgi:hypothetical protein